MISYSRVDPDCDCGVGEGKGRGKGEAWAAMNESTIRLRGGGQLLLKRGAVRYDMKGCPPGCSQYCTVLVSRASFPPCVPSPPWSLLFDQQTAHETSTLLRVCPAQPTRRVHPSCVSLSLSLSPLFLVLPAYYRTSQSNPSKNETACSALPCPPRPSCKRRRDRRRTRPRTVAG